MNNYKIKQLLSEIEQKQNQIKILLDDMNNYEKIEPCCENCLRINTHMCGHCVKRDKWRYNDA